MKKMEIFFMCLGKQAWWFSPPWLCLLSILASDFSRTCCFLCHWLFQNHRQKTNQNPTASPAFFRMTRLECCNKHIQEEEEGVGAVGVGGLYTVGVISVPGALGTSSCVFCSSPRAALGSGAWRTLPGSLWSWAGCGAVLISILQALCVQQVQKRQ